MHYSEKTSELKKIQNDTFIYSGPRIRPIQKKEPHKNPILITSQVEFVFTF